MRTRTRSNYSAVKAGSFTLGEARQAARSVKTGRFVMNKRSGHAADALRERYLGHFGAPVKSSGSAKASGKGGAAKKSATKSAKKKHVKAVKKAGSSKKR
jgi:hypothetical protein